MANKILKNTFQYPGGQIFGTGVIDLNSKIKETNHIEHAFEAIKNKKGKLLDIGCGGGQYSKTIKKKYGNRFDVYACDIDEKVIEFNKRNDKTSGVHYAIGDIQKLPYKDKEFDAVVFFDVLEHVYHPDKALSEINRVLKDDGVLFCYVPCENNHFTLHWLLWKFRIGYNIKLDNGGHVQRFNFPVVEKKVENAGFIIEDEHYELGPIGQFFDFLIFSVLGLKSISGYLWKIRWSGEKKESKESLVSSVLKFIKKVVYATIYYESKFVDFIHIKYFALGLYLTCKKNKDI